MRLGYSFAVGGVLHERDVDEDGPGFEQHAEVVHEQLHELFDHLLVVCLELFRRAGKALDELLDLGQAGLPCGA